MTPSPSLLLQAVPPAQTALEKFNEHADDLASETPLERLRYFCSQAMNGQDWLDVEQFFDAVEAAHPGAQEQPKPNTEAAHQVAPVGTTLPPALSEDTPPIVWPKADRVVRRDDMSQTGKLTVMVQRDGDVVVNVCNADDGWESATVEFCAGGGGGGRSMRTREALIALMVAIEADNEARPIAAQAAQPKDAA